MLTQLKTFYLFYSLCGFSSSVRLLIGDSLRNKIVNGIVKTSIVSEQQAKTLNNNNIDAPCDEIANDQVNLEVKENYLKGHFKSMLLKIFKRNDKKSCKMVTVKEFVTVSMEVLQLSWLFTVHNKLMHWLRFYWNMLLPELTARILMCLRQSHGRNSRMLKAANAFRWPVVE